jgi:two-component system response regulator DesR
VSQGREGPEGPLAPPAPIRVALVEDNKVFREALELLLGLRSDVQVVASVEHGNDIVSLCREHEPDVVVIDYRLPGMDGVEATTALRQACPEVAVLCLTASANPREMEAMRQAGAVACMSKDEQLDEIVGAILNAAVPASG